MKTVLRLGFAMGGGVSLGTFSGAALAQTIKLLILRGVDRRGEPFKRVEIDVFSGASAGSMSLGLMLRSLVHASPARQEKARAKLQAEFPREFGQCSRARQRDLIAAQIVQDVQEEVWVERINLDTLLGKRGAGQARLRHCGSLLDRGAVDALAAEYFGFKRNRVRLARRLLARRVLFASTLTSLTGTVADARKTFSEDTAVLVGLLDGMRSKLHSELRVFDLNFAEVPQADFDDETRHPARWCRYHEGDERQGTNGTLKDPRTWNKIAATAVASGAFPFAFEPVVLKRKRFEYGEGEWPAPLADRSEYPFTFVDGGAFNNEPIREAFRLASFIDAQPGPDSFERCIVFVDPKSSDEALPMRVPIHQEWFLQDPNQLGTFDGVDLERRTSLDRLLPELGQVAAMFTAQATRVEGDKVLRTHDRFALRNNARSLLDRTLESQVALDSLATLKTFCSDQLEKNRLGDMIPATSVTITTELSRVIDEERSENPETPLARLYDKIAAFLEDPAGATGPERALWLRALTFVAVDLLMDLSGKLNRARLVAIAPVEGLDQPENQKLYSLPGGQVFGFAGFTSEVARRHDVEVARHCAQLFLQAASPDLVQKRALPPFPEWESHRVQFLADLEAGMQDLAQRVNDLIKDSHLINVLPGVDPLIKRFVAGKLAKAVEAVAKPAERRLSYQFRIEVPDKNFEFDGRGLADRDIGPQRMGDKLYLVTFAEREVAGGFWSGPHLGPERKTIQIDRDGLLRDRCFCKIRLPGIEDLAHAECLPNPTFLTTISKADKDKTLPAARWQLLDPGVESLDDRLGNLTGD